MTNHSPTMHLFPIAQLYQASTGWLYGGIVVSSVVFFLLGFLISTEAQVQINTTSSTTTSLHEKSGFPSYPLSVSTANSIHVSTTNSKDGSYVVEDRAFCEDGKEERILAHLLDDENNIRILSCCFRVPPAKRQVLKLLRNAQFEVYLPTPETRPRFFPASTEDRSSQGYGIEY